eukprot:5377440-Prymnesium_polylepis.2
MERGGAHEARISAMVEAERGPKERFRRRRASIASFALVCMQSHACRVVCASHPSDEQLAVSATL